jgi:hypothetical protein
MLLVKMKNQVYGMHIGLVFLGFQFEEVSAKVKEQHKRLQPI